MYANDKYPAVSLRDDHACFAPAHRSQDRIRVAYVSSDFRNHAIGFLTVGLFEHHDRSRFEMTAISIGVDQNSDVRRRIRNSVEHFIDAKADSDQHIVDLIRGSKIDIAVDLNGFTIGARPNIFARRPTPIQVNYLGYPGTLGANYYDYIVADRTLIPDNECEFYAENVVWLPNSYQANDNQRPISENTPTRSDCGLPDDAFVFCCFNNAFKIMPTIFDIWMRLLKAREGSVLWLLESNPAVSANLRREAESRGVSSERLIFAPRIPLADHLARQRQADLFLDTLPYNAHTTASDALWAGLPLLTCIGSTFAGRVAASLLNAAGLAELITTSLEDYEALALKISNDPGVLASLKDRLALEHDKCPLFNTERFTRHIEAAYTTMWERYQRGEAPRSFLVNPIQ
jgi:predicted O-linked N-acetylglucosamine transferase (SPINDLY family)